MNVVLWAKRRWRQGTELERSIDRVGMHTVQGPDPVDRQLRWQVDHDAYLPRLAGTIPEVEVVQGDLADDGVQLVTRDDAYRRERPRHIVDHRFLDLRF